MAKWTVTPGTAHNSMAGAIQYDDSGSQWEIKQNVDSFLEQAKMDRETLSSKDTGFKKFATIPDIIAIQIKQNHDIDIHAQDTMGDKDKMAKFMLIVKQEYPHLLSY